MVLLLTVSLRVLLGGLPLAASPPATGGIYTLGWTAVAGGSSEASGGRYSLAATSAQPSAAISVGGSYRMTTGFWAGAATRDYVVYLPVVLSG